MSEIIAYFTARTDVIEYILSGILVAVVLVVHWHIVGLTNDYFIKKYGSYDKIPEDEKFPPPGY